MGVLDRLPVLRNIGETVNFSTTIQMWWLLREIRNGGFEVPKYADGDTE